MFKKNDLILFQGDSITDCGRDRTNPDALGNGYAMMLSAWLSAMFPEKSLRFFNRGISGNRADDLVRRWQADCLDLKPGWVSILIGINDTWRAFDSHDPTSTQAFEENVQTILDRTAQDLDANIILCEPFLLHHPEDRLQWRKDLNPKIEVVRRMVEEYHSIFVPLDKVFQEKSVKVHPSFWAADGVHPSLAGHALIAQTWLKHVCNRSPA